MSEDNIENLPSVNDFQESSDGLPSVEEYLVEESIEELPSVEEYIQPEKEEIEEATEEEVAEDLVDLNEVIRLVNDVRKDIPQIPEIKSYDEELKQLAEDLEEVRESIPSVPEVKYYDAEVDAICNQIDLVREEISHLPEVKYYDEQVTSLEDKIEIIKQELINLPEIKHYDGDLQSIKEEIQEVRKAIVPDFGWIGNTFNVIDENVITLNDGLQSLKDKFDTDFQSLSEDIDTKDFEKRVSIEEINTRLDEVKTRIWKELSENAEKIWGHHREFKDDDRKLKKQILGQYNLFKKNINEQIEEYNKNNVESQNIITDSLREYFNSLKNDISHLPEVKYYDDDIIRLQKDFSTIKERVEEKTLNLAELYRLVDELKTQQKELQEVYNDRPIGPDPALKQGEDPLTPTDQKFATLQDLASNYRLFVNRVEQQLYTIGGGGAGFLKDMADVNVSGIENNYVLVWNSTTSMWDVAAQSGGGVGFTTDPVGISTTAKVGIGTTARADYDLYIQGDGYIGGNWNIQGDLTYDEVNARNANISGVSTSGKVHVGIDTGFFSEDLVVNGSARITGILTVGTESVTIGSSSITIGDENVVIGDSYVNIGDNVTINAGASGINSAPGVLYVAKDGDDDKNGTSIDNAFLTIAGAVGAATSGTTVKVLSGTYVESNPIEVPAFVSIVGDDQRTVSISGSFPHKDIFSVRKGCKLSNMTFQNHVSPAAAVGFPTGEIAENVGGGKWKGPYVQNCTSNTTTGTGIRIDGDQARLLKAMNVDAFTQYNEGGVGVAVTNGGFAQLVSLFTICCNEAVTCDKGGQADIANSNCSFGTYGLIARGVNDLQYSGIVTTAADAAQDNVILNISNTNPTFNISDVNYTHQTGVATVTTSAAHNFQVGMGVTLADIVFSCTYGSKTYPYRRPYVFEVDSIPNTTSFVANLGISTVAHTYSSGGTARIETDRPYDGQVCYFDTLYYSVETIAVGSGGTGYTSTPDVTVSAPEGPSGESATAFATLEGESVASITVISSGNQYESTPTVTIGAPNVGINTATATPTIAPIYYTINSSTPVTAGITTLTLDENLINAVGVGTTAYFFEVSKIIASSHTFEYVGAGNQIANATPKRGGVTVQANEVITEDGGKVLYTSTDQAGNFRIGDDLQINQNTGTISGRSFSKSLFSEMTPFILALS
tara:strand:- start:474 stop:4001 length:3528 start_codon:yes stop_codon:yes gene_type:complete